MSNHTTINPTAELSLSTPPTSTDVKALLTISRQLQFQTLQCEYLCQSIAPKVYRALYDADPEVRDDLLYEVQDLESEIKASRLTGKELEKRVVAVGTELKSLEANNAEKIGQVANLMNSIKELGVQIEQHDQEQVAIILKKELSLKEAVNKETELNAQVSKLELQISDLAATQATVQDKHNRLIQDYQRKLELRESHMSMLQGSLNEAKGKFTRQLQIQSELETQVANLQKDIDKHAETIQQKDSAIQAKNSAIEAATESMAVKRTQLMKDLTTKDDEIKTLKLIHARKIESSQKELTSVWRDLHSGRVALNAKNNQVNKLTEGQACLDHSINQLKDTLSTKESTIDELTKSLQEQNLTVKEQAHQIDQLLNDIGHTAAVNQSQDRELARLDKTVKERNMEIEGLKWRANVLNDSLNDSDAKAASLQESLLAASSKESGLLQRLKLETGSMQLVINACTAEIREKDGDIMWLRSQLIKATGIEVAEGEEINFLDSHFVRSVNANDTLNDEDFGGYVCEEEDFDESDGSEPEQLTIPFVLNDGEFRRLATKEEMQGNIDARLLELQSPLVQDYFHDLWNSVTATDTSGQDKCDGVKMGDSYVMNQVKHFYRGESFNVINPDEQVGEDKGSEGKVSNDAASTEPTVTKDDGATEEWDVVSSLSAEAD